MRKSIILSSIICILGLSSYPLFTNKIKKDNTHMLSPGNIVEINPISKVDPTSISNSLNDNSDELKNNTITNNSTSSSIDNKNEKNIDIPNSKEVKIVKKASSKDVSLNKSNSSNRNARISRGGSIPKITDKSKTSKSTSSNKNTYSSKIEILDWKIAKNVFSINTIAEVTDVYTKKTFKVKRTMGTNHADSEALTKEDTEIIKSIWGGFSWERRPVILNIKGRRIAASMSAMPHAGIDSAPAYKIINNRSDGYGRGQNLDVIKGNGMDGHFDIHFLNSTRHKDGKKDPQHQAAVLKAAK
ncbi:MULTISPECIES: hypothetical protein [Clostridium]|uniref:Uncharacterized protein n=2 Tax=Clostridium TaxID=1485 RepID=A0A151AS26_9CLOT|nr:MULTISPECIES: hypothetical protein [Clostridium]KYH30383.1 hypothetical protein CLCOL_03290 [Clostridium colicanis DSM 13634]PRR76460.1 hypothetical protein CPAL_01310 [Clostridium thermopalmarium DSM 5974]PVZ28427.1 hypothetical protein LX19_00399 [Clostridium thermopalmarium DSM 5974]